MGWHSVWMVLVLVGSGLALAPTPGQGPQRCNYERAYHMFGAHCSALNLHDVPTGLKNTIQILDVSFNRIRDLRNTTFSRYTSLRYLYLGDNMIQNVEAGTFEPLSYLETLDLSLNALTTIPDFVLNMPTLRKLYISDNVLSNLKYDVEKMEKPLKAPLNFISISNCKLSELPDFGVLPELEHLNISGNEFKTLTPGNFAKFCALKNLDFTGALSTQDICPYKLLANWFIEKNVDILPDVFSIANASEEALRCPEMQINEEDINVYNECRSSIKSKKREKMAKKTWIVIAGCLGGFLICFIILLYWLHRRNVRQTTKRNKQAVEDSNQISNKTNLLNDVS